MVDSMHSTSGKARKSGHSQKQLFTSVSASSQVVERYLPGIEGLQLEDSVPCWSDTRQQSNRWGAFRLFVCDYFINK